MSSKSSELRCNMHTTLDVIEEKCDGSLEMVGDIWKVVPSHSTLTVGTAKAQ